MPNPRKQAASLLNNPSVLEFCHDTLNTPLHDGLVVAIARRTPRMLELVSSLDDDRVQVVSNLALPWIAGSGGKLPQHLRFVDDIWNCGTSIERELEFTKEHFPDSHLDVMVYASRAKFADQHGKSELLSSMAPTSPRMRLGEEAFRRFQTWLPQAIMAGGKPLDLEFPIFSMSLSQKVSHHSSEEWQQSMAEHFSSVHSLTMPTQRTTGISAITVISPIQEVKSAKIPFSKVRLFFSRDEQIVRMVPMVIPFVAEEALVNPREFLPTELANLFTEIAPLAVPGHTFSEEPRYRLLLFLLSWAYGQRFLPHLRKSLGMDARGHATLDIADLKLLFGPKLGVQIHATLIDLAKQQHFDPEPLSTELPGIDPPPTPPFKNELAQQVEEKLRETGYIQCNMFEVLSQAMYVLEEINGSNRFQFPYERLRNGLTFQDLHWLLGHLKTQGTVNDIALSFALDYLVDSGALVPVNELHEGRYLRTYRPGEAKPINFAIFMHSVLIKLAEACPNNPNLNITSFKKILAIMALRNPGYLPLRPTFDRFGSVPIMNSSEETGQQVEEAVDFLKRKGIIIESSKDLSYRNQSNGKQWTLDLSDTVEGEK